MGVWRTYELEPGNAARYTWSRSAARKSELPLGAFKAYHPDPLCSPGFHQPQRWAAVAASAETKLRSLEKRHGDSAGLLGWLLCRSEGIGSSTIEGVDPSLRRVARVEAVARKGRQPFDRSALEAIGNVEATELAVELGDRHAPLHLDDLLQLHSKLMDYTDRPEIGGCLRPGWVYIGGVLGGYPPPAYVAPPANLIPGLLNDLLEYINTSPHHPLVVAAVAHSQFETIHPFSDGNGRTGRALIQTVLRSRGSTRTITVPFSAVLATRQADYISALNNAHYEGDSGGEPQADSFDDMVFLLAEVAVQACAYTEQVVQDVDAIYAGWQQQIMDKRRDSSVHKILAVLPSLPVFTVNDIAARASIPAKTAYRSVRQLADLGIVEPVRGKHKGQGLFEAGELLDLFAPGHERNLQHG